MNMRSASSDAVPEAGGRRAGELPAVLGRFDTLTVVVGSIIGSGIFLKPAVVAQSLDSFGLIIGVWIVVGLITLCGSLAVAELAAMLPHAGGPYVFLREAYGRLPGFLLGWTEYWVIRTGSLGALAAATVIYASQVVPMGRALQEWATIGIVVFVSAVNIVGTRWAARVQNVATIVKVGFLAVLIVLPFALGRVHGAYLLPLVPAEYSPSIWKGLGAALIAVMWPYDGWVHVSSVAEEVREPQRNVPAALGLGMLIVIGLYVSANIAYHVVLPLEAIRSSSAVATDVCRALLGPVGGSVVAVGVMCSTFGAVNANVLTGPRVYFAMARDGLLPGSIHRIHERYQTPSNAILMQAGWTIVLILAAYAWKGDPREAFDVLTNYVIFGASVFYALAVAAVFVLRWRRPELPRPYRTWGYPVVPALYLLFFGAALASLLAVTPWESAAGTVLIAAGVVFYILSGGRRTPESGGGRRRTRVEPQG